MSGLYEVTPAQATIIMALLQDLEAKVNRPQGSPINPDDLVRALRTQLQVAAVYDQLPEPVSGFDPDDFLYLSLPRKVLDRPIEQLKFSTAAYNRLKTRGVDCVGQLLEWTEDELLDITKFGPKYLDEVKDRLGAHLHLSRHDQGLEAPPGDKWVPIVGRTILRSRLSGVFVDSLLVEHNSNGSIIWNVLIKLRVSFHIERVGTLLALTWADILAFDWAAHSLDPDDALSRIKSALAQYQLVLREI